MILTGQRRSLGELNTGLLGRGPSGVLDARPSVYGPETLCSYDGQDRQTILTIDSTTG